MNPQPSGTPEVPQAPQWPLARLLASWRVIIFVSYLLCGGLAIALVEDFGVGVVMVLPIGWIWCAAATAWLWRKSGRNGWTGLAMGLVVPPCVFTAIYMLLAQALQNEREASGWRKGMPASQKTTPALPAYEQKSR